MSNRAAIIPSKGARLEVVQVEKYTPQKGELLIRTHVVATNPVDWKVQKYGIFVDKFPFILASDVAGVVEQVGEGVTNFKTGDKVWCWTPILSTLNSRFGGFQNYTILPAAAAGRIPSNFTLEQAVGLGLPAATAIVGLFICEDVPRPTSTTRPTPAQDKPILFVSGGGSAVGAAAIQLGALAGVTVFATASPKHFDLVRSYGATQVFDYRDDNLVENVKQHANGRPVRWVYDAVSGADTLEKSIQILNNQGSLITVLPVPADLAARAASIKKSPIIAGKLFAPENSEVLAWYTTFLPNAVEAGTFVTNKPEIIGNSVDDAQKILDYHASGQVSASKPLLKLVE